MARKKSNPLKNRGFAAGLTALHGATPAVPVPPFAAEERVWTVEALGVLRVKARMLGLARVHFHRVDDVKPVGTGATFQRSRVRTWEFAKERLCWETYFLGKGMVSMTSPKGLEAMARELAGRNISAPMAWRVSSEVAG